jgi:signal transduction histidine kinase
VLLARHDAMAGALRADQRRAVALGGAAAAGLMLPLAMLIARSWTLPLRRMRRAVIGLASDDRPERLTESGDEVGQLARAFNWMSDRLWAARQELMETNRNLEATVAKRTSALVSANDRLTAEMAEKDAFLRAVSHDLGAPLRNIDGMAGMLLLKYRTQLSDDALRKIERIAANARMQTDLINDLLDLSRLRASADKREPVALDAVVTQIAESLAHELEQYDIAFDHQPPLPTVWAEPNRIRQVMQNLIDNAVKYTRGRPERRITVRSRQRSGEHVVEVIDTGCGIDPQDQRGIFQVFKRTRQAEGSGVDGRGVGLAGVKSILESHAGWIQVESEPGRGSTFRIGLPKLPPAAASGAVASGSASARAAVGVGARTPG